MDIAEDTAAVSTAAADLQAVGTGHFQAAFTAAAITAEQHTPLAANYCTILCVVLHIRT